MRFLLFSLILLFFGACSYKQPQTSKSATVIFYANGMKFYDSGFISQYNDKIHLTIYSFGKIAFDVDIYEDRICKSTFECISSKEFNTKYLHSSYDDKFLYTLFKSKKINFKDKQNNIKIKVIDK